MVVILEFFAALLALIASAVGLATSIIELIERQKE